jgi:hypothetical protein
MAFLDFLGRTVGSDTVPVNQNTTMAGTAGASQGPTWGDVMQLASSGSGSGPPSIANVSANQRSGVGTIKPETLMETAVDKQKRENQDSLGAILSILLSVI